MFNISSINDYVTNGKNIKSSSFDIEKIIEEYKKEYKNIQIAFGIINANYKIDSS